MPDAMAKEMSFNVIFAFAAACSIASHRPLRSVSLLPVMDVLRTPTRRSPEAMIFPSRSTM